KRTNHRVTFLRDANFLFLFRGIEIRTLNAEQKLCVSPSTWRLRWKCNAERLRNDVLARKVVLLVRLKNGLEAARIQTTNHRDKIRRVVYRQFPGYGGVKRPLFHHRFRRSAYARRRWLLVGEDLSDSLRKEKVLSGVRIAAPILK